MPLDQKRLKCANNLVSVVADNATRTGVFVDLGGELHMLAALAATNGNGTIDRRIPDVMRSLQYIAQDLWNIETLFDRLEWQHKSWVANELSDDMWFRYASADIDMIHIETRSLFDYIAQALWVVSAKPGQVPDESFEKLRNWANKNRTDCGRLGKNISELLLACEWFPDLRNVRDDLVHRGARTLVFLDKPSFCFQIYNGHRKSILLPEVMVNENVVDFRLYGGVIYGYLLAFLEDVADTLCQSLNVTPTPGQTRHHSSGIRVGKLWLEKVLELS